MPIHVRRATVSDSKEISFIGVESWRAAYRGIVPDSYLDSLSVDEREKRLMKSLSVPENHFAIAEIDHHVAGMILFYQSFDAGASEGVWEVEAIYVLPEYWSQGVGKALIGYGFQKMKEADAQRCKLWVFKDNWHARKFYERVGFILSGDKKTMSIHEKELMVVCYQLNL